MKRIRSSLLTIAIACASVSAYASEPVDAANTSESAEAAQQPAGVQPAPSFSHFTWGADLGSSIDMTGQEMTAFDLTANFGYKSDFIRFAGLGAGIKMMVSNSSRAYPLYAMFRSGFSSRPTFCFLEAKAGVAVMNLHEATNRTKFYGSLGVGFTLAKGSNFSSHIVLAYEFIPLKTTAGIDSSINLKDFHFASLRIGASF